ncbi:MAG: TetR/AcrR family transcriptional regulator [Solirubrobacterales bacterium]
MVQTPWGNADQLRERMLRPGPGMPREVVEKSQRERLFAATVACVAAKGYEATTVADVLELSGVSRSAFYDHFRDKEECFLATFEALAAKSMELVDRVLTGEGPLEERARNAMHGLLELMVDQPAAARLCFCDVYAVGERGRQAVERPMESFAMVIGEAIGQIRGGEALPDEMVRAVLGGAQLVIQSHLLRDEVDALPKHAGDLWEWALGYEPPSAPLRLAGRRPPQSTDGEPPFLAFSQAERIIRALAAVAFERGYPAVTIADIAARASVSQATFYSYFPDKHAALVAALDSAGAQMLGVVMPAARRAPDWPNSIRAAIGALCAFCAAEPDLAWLTAVEAYSAGSMALEKRDRIIDEMGALLAPGFDTAPTTKPIVADAALRTVWALLHGQIATAGPQDLPQVAPLASYMVLAPFIGAEQAVEVSNGDGRGR